MARFDKLKESLNKTVSKAAEGVKNTGKQLSNSLKEVDIKNVAESVKNKTQEIVDTAKKTNPETIKKSIREMRTNVSEKLATFKKNSEETDKAVKKALVESEMKNNSVSINMALKIMYLLMACDGEVTREEDEKFTLIAKDLLENNIEEKNKVIEWCTKVINSVEEEEDYYDTVRDGIAEAMKEPVSEGSVIDSKILLWNLVVIAYSDENYSNNEGKILRFVARSLGVDRAFIPEMESSVQAIMAIEKEEEFLRNSDRKYGKIEAEMNELADRKTTIMHGIHALILD